VFTTLIQTLFSSLDVESFLQHKTKLSNIQTYPQCWYCSKCSHPWCKHSFIFGCGVALTTISNIIFQHTSKFTLSVSVHNLDANFVSSLDVESLLQQYQTSYKQIHIVSKCSQPWCKLCFIFGCGVSLMTISNSIIKHTSKFTLPVSVHNLDANNVSSLDVESLLRQYQTAPSNIQAHSHCQLVFTTLFHLWQ